MATYYFHVDNGSGALNDELGQDFPSDDLAIAEGGRTAGGILADDLRAGCQSVHVAIRIQGERGHVATIEVQGTISR